MKAPGGFPAAAGLALLLVLAACGGAGSDVPPRPADDELVIVTPMPATPAAVGGPAPGRAYVVQEGDTLSGIAARFDVPEGALQSANGLADPNRLVVGQELVIPPVEP